MKRRRLTITYFQPDERKAGGKYVTATGAVIKVDDFERLITMQDGTKIPMDDVLSIDGELFSSLRIMSLAMRPNEVNTEVQYDCKVRHQA